MAEISGFPYYEVQFTKEAAINDPKEVQRAVDGISKEQITDLFTFSHGWNNDMDEARELYKDFFASMRQVIDQGKAPGLAKRKCAVLAILWPSKKFADSDLIASGAA